MKRIYLSITFIFFNLMVLKAQNEAVITGKVVSNEQPILFANVALLGTAIGSETDLEGNFKIESIPVGEYEFAISAVGYKSFFQKIQLAENQNLNLGSIELEEDVLGLEEIVVTGTMKETFITDSPIKVEVITGKYLEKNTSPTNLVEGITLVNGVEEVVECGVCYTNSIRINGLPGPYTAILMDGTPMFGNLASVYGLNGIPTSIIDRFEIIKGPSSTLYGSEAVAGVINVITKNPKKQPLLTTDVMGTTHKESFGNLTFAPQIGKWSAYVGADYAYINDFEDENLDGFGDFVSLDRISLFTKWSLDRKDEKTLSVFGKYYYEDRRNGVEAFLQDRNYRELRGSDEVYGESIYTNRLELFGTYDLPTEENLKLNFSFSQHKQDSYYGVDFYEASQRISFTNFLWDKELGSHNLIIGSTARHQFYDDNTIATQTNEKNKPDNQFIPGIFLQDEWTLSKRLTLLVGTRFDHYDAHGLIIAPRLNAKFKPEQWTTFRFNFGTGFRIVNLFTEDHAFITGQREVEIIEDLLPERSYNVALNLNHIYTIGNSQGSLDLDVFYTYFTNKIIPDYSTPNKIIYANSDGHAVSKGLGLNINQSFMFPLVINAGFTLQKVTQTEPNEHGDISTSDVEFAPQLSSIATFNYVWKKKSLVFAYTFRLTGQMALPEVFDFDENGLLKKEPRPTKSENYMVHNFQISKALKKQNLTIYTGVQNILDYRQSFSPLVGFNDPNAAAGFSDNFDTAYAFAPIHGREWYLGVKWHLNR